MQANPGTDSSKIPILRTRRYAAYSGAAWTLLVLGLLAYNISQRRAEIVELARASARELVDRDLVYRRWIEEIGGVFVDASKLAVPRLSVTLPNADLETTSGTRLTRLGWASVAHGVYSRAADDGRMHSHMTSLKPIAIENAPDAWEAMALQEFERGAAEKSEVVAIEGVRRLRFMRRLLTEQSCLECHAQQGYRVGDVRGGITVEIPLDRYADKERSAVRGLVAGFGSLWAVGLLSILVGSRRLEARVREREQMLLAAEQSQNRYRLIVETTRDGFWMADANGRLREVNDAYCRMSGYSRDELLSMSVWDVSDAPREIMLERLELIRQGKLNSFQSQHRRKDGSLFEADLSVTHLSGDVEQAVVFVRDISGRKRAEEALAEERERLAVTLRSIGDGVITTDTAGRVAILNKAAEDLTGWSQQESRGQPLGAVLTILEEDTRNPVPNLVETALAVGAVNELADRAVLVAKDGAKRLVSASSAPIRAESGAAIGVVVIFRDVTEKQRYAEVAQQSAKLESVGILAGGIAHDFNNLLTGLFGYIELSRNAVQDGTVARYLDLSLGAVNRARGLTRQLLTFAKGGAPILRTGNLRDMVVETVNFSLSGSSVSSQFEVAPDVWLCDFDSTQIAQVVENVVINALHAMPLGGMLTVTVANVKLAPRSHSVLDAGPYVRISIRDSGIGMSKEVRARIFDPFFTTKQKGSGLGLSTSYSIVRRHGGCIDAESELGRGSVFHVYLPASPGRTLEQTSSSQTKKNATGRILVMDDEPDIRELVTDVLQQSGYAVAGAGDGGEALRMFSAEKDAGRPFAAVLLDLTVPGGMGGQDTVKELRRRGEEVPVFVMSGYAQDPVLAHPAEFGFTDGLAKPFLGSDLLRLFGRHLA